MKFVRVLQTVQCPKQPEIQRGLQEKGSGSWGLILSGVLHPHWYAWYSQKEVSAVFCLPFTRVCYRLLRNQSDRSVACMWEQCQEVHDMQPSKWDWVPQCHALVGPPRVAAGGDTGWAGTPWLAMSYSLGEVLGRHPVSGWGAVVAQSSWLATLRTCWQKHGRSLSWTSNWSCGGTQSTRAGLKIGKATCYMNSYLQTLFFTNQTHE